MAVYPLGLSFANSFITNIPSGVEAFPSPNSPAAMLRLIASKSLLFGFTSLNKSLIIGDRAFENNLFKPDFSIIFIMPPQKQNTPNTDSKNSTDCLPDAIIALDKPSVLPQINENITLRRIMAHHI